MAVTASLPIDDQQPIVEAAPKVESKPLVEARPVFLRNTSSVWTQATEKCARIHRYIAAHCEKRGLETMVLRSNADIYPPWIEWECWLRRGQITERIKLSLFIQPHPHHRHELAYLVRTENRGRRRRQRLYSRLDGKMLSLILDSLLDDRPLPVFPGRRLRLHWYEFWHRSNRPKALRKDFVTWAIRAVVALAAAYAMISEAGREVLIWIWELRGAMQSFLLWDLGFSFLRVFAELPFLGPVVLVAAAFLFVRRHTRVRGVLLAAAVALGFMFQPMGWLLEGWYIAGNWLLETLVADTFVASSPGWFLALLGAAAVGLLVYGRHRRFDVLNVGKPLVEPRQLRLADYWHTVLPDIGASHDDVERRFLAAVKHTAHPELRWSMETVMTRGPEGTEEREQVVLSFRRSLVYCQFHAYGDELYLGWDAYLNEGQWVEKEVTRGIDRRTGRRTIVSTVHPGQQRLTEYDIVDLNCLIEWTHERMTKLVKTLLHEHDIEAEIDFTIQRAERHQLSAAPQQQERKGGLMKRGQALLRRTA